MRVDGRSPENRRTTGMPFGPLRKETMPVRLVVFLITRRLPSSFAQSPMNLSISDSIAFLSADRQKLRGAAFFAASLLSALLALHQSFSYPTWVPTAIKNGENYNHPINDAIIDRKRKAFGKLGGGIRKPLGECPQSKTGSRYQNKENRGNKTRDQETAIHRIDIPPQGPSLLG